MNSNQPAYVARVGTTENMRRRMLEPAVALADRLAAEGRKRDAEILRRLLRSHGAQRGMLQNYAAMVQRTPSGHRWNRAHATKSPASPPAVGILHDEPFGSAGGEDEGQDQAA